MIVWAVVADRNGVTKPDPRPILVTSIHPSDKQAPFVGHCISTKGGAFPEDPFIEMPWNATTGAGVGLYEWCAVVLKWLVIVDQSTIQDVTGAVENAFLNKVLDAIEDVRAGRDIRAK